MSQSLPRSTVFVTASGQVAIGLLRLKDKADGGPPHVAHCR